MKIYEYESYEEYKKEQEKANRKKINNVWVIPKTIKTVASIYGPKAQTIICHGTRNAAEQKLFKELYPYAEIIGTEISSTASQFPMTIQWDFTKEKSSWKGKFDILYSNSFDHSNLPEKTLQTWKSQLSKNGKMFLEHGYTPLDNKSRPSDPLEITSEELEHLILKSGFVIEQKFDTYGLNKKECKSKVYVCSL